MGTYETQALDAAPPAAVADEAAAEPARERGELRGASYEAGSATLSPTPEGEPPTEEERVAAAKASWEALFGQAVGSRLFDLVREHVSLEALTGYAHDGVSALADAVPGLVKPTKPGAAGGLLDETSEAEALQKLLAALSPRLTEAADAWLASESGQKVLTAISQWVEEHPAVVATAIGTAAIGAAVAAYLSNMDVPALTQTFKLGAGLSADASLDLGKLQQLGVQAASATVKWKGEQARASIGASWTEDGGVTATATGGVEADVRGAQLTADGTLTVQQDGTAKLKLDGGLASTVRGTPLELGLGLAQQRGPGQGPATDVEARLAWGAEGERTGIKGKWDPGSDAFTLSLDRTLLGGDLMQSYGLTRDAEGNLTSTSSQTAKLGGGQTFGVRSTDGPGGAGTEMSWSRERPQGGGLSADASVGTGTLAGAHLGLAYQRDALEAELDLAMKDGASTLGLSASAGQEGQLQGSASATFDLSAGRVQELAAQLGWKDTEAFRSWLVRYRANWMAENQQMAHHFEAVLEYAVGRVSGRFTGGLDLQGSQLSGNRADLLLGYQVHQDWAVLAGGGYEGARSMDTGGLEGQGYLRAGLQYKDIAVTATYRPDGNTWGLGISIPLGRR